MLFSRNSCGMGRPLFTAWFGNFFEPYFSDEEACRRGLEDLKNMGFNGIVLDSKLWTNFTEYFESGKESPYVRMQKYIVEQCRRLGLGVTFLALYCNGDNLYPDIYDYPPDFVEQPIDIYGKPLRGYRQWSKKQLDAKVRHCLNLYQHIARDTPCLAEDEQGRERLPFYFYHDPVFCPSFDADGITHYLTWLEKRYTLDEVNKRYGTHFSNIREMKPRDYWVSPEQAEDGRDLPTEADYANRSPAVLKYADNQDYKNAVMTEMFRYLIEALRQAEPRFYFYASLSQWKYFLNECDHYWFWDCSRRNTDIWKVGRYFDTPSFNVYPADAFGEPNAFAVGCELAMLRSASRDDTFVAGLFLGRYIFNDLYRIYSPQEVFASALGSGATDLFFYGYNGLDDGGNFGKWDDEKKRSVRRGLDWFAQVREISGKRLKPKKAAIIFPYATFFLHSARPNPALYSAFRQDTLGWYQQLAELGLNCDILHPDQVKAGALEDYRLAVCPANPLYRAAPDGDLEQALLKFSRAGGVVMRSQSDGFEEAFGIAGLEHEEDSIVWDEQIVTPGIGFRCFENGRAIAYYKGTDKTAIALHECGKGHVYSFGIDFGYACTVKRQLPVPPKYGRDNQYPLTVIEKTPVEKILLEQGLASRRHRLIEDIPFETGRLVINHSPLPITVDGDSRALSTFPGFNGTDLPSHSAVFLPGKGL